MLRNRLYEYLKFLKSLAKTTFRLIVGMWRLTKMPQPAITVFGAARIAPESEHALSARKLAKMLVAHGFSIITGGGPGIMEAANLGAIDHLKECSIDDTDCKSKVVSAGIGLVRLNKDRLNPYIQETIVMEHFFARKWLLVRYSVGFVVFPGGFGTMDELFELVTLVQTNRMAHVPIVLMDKNFWRPLINWIETTFITQGLIRQDERNLFTVVDTPEEAFAILSHYCAGATESVTYHYERK